MAPGSSGGMSSAEPEAMLAFANAVSAMVDELTPRLQQLGAEALAYQLKPHPGGPDLSDYAYGTDPVTRVAVQLTTFADRVRQIGVAFRSASELHTGAVPERIGRLEVADADLDAAVQRLNAPPVYRDQSPLAGRLVSGPAAFASYPPGEAAAGGYHQRGALVGPDGRTYPLAVPYLAEDGVVYTADAEPVRDGVDVLGGADRGWQVIGTELGTTPVADSDGTPLDAPYTVTYEEHPDGRVRAQLTISSVTGHSEPAAGSGGSLALGDVARHAVYANGALVPIVMRVRARRKAHARG